MTERAEQMVLDYLARVGETVQGSLSPRERARFLADLRSRVNAACTNTGDPQEVRRVLDEFGEPPSLVAREFPSASDPDGEEAVADVPAPVRANPYREPRDPPPWRGGSEGNWLGWSTNSQGVLREGSPSLRGLVTAGRRNPAEILAIVVYLVSGAIGQITVICVVGAALVALSKVWTRADRWIALGVPLLATAVGMLLWSGNAAYIDRILLMSLLDTGIIGLRAAVVGCGMYLAVRIARINRPQ